MTFNWLSGLRERLAFYSRLKLKLKRVPKSRRRIPSPVAGVVELLEARKLLTPVISNVETTAFPFTVNAPVHPVTSSLTLTDTSSTVLVGATLRVEANYTPSEDVLVCPTKIGNISFVYDASVGQLTFAGTDSLANYQAALRSVTYQNTSSNPNTAIRRFQLTATDGTSGSVPAYRYFNVTSMISNVETTPYSYTEGDPATPITNQIVLAPTASGSLLSASIRIDANYSSLNGEDVLSFTNTSQIAGAWDSGTATMTLSAISGQTPTVADFQAALRSVTYTNTSQNPSSSPRRFAIWTNDGDTPTLDAYRFFNIIPVDSRPVLSNLESTSYPYTENDPATVISNAIAVSDVDNATLASATVSVDANYTPGEDVLSFTPDPTTMGNIAVVSNAGGVLSLASAGATATTANWQAALRAVTYQNTSHNPNPAIRRFLFQISDGTVYSIAQYRYFTIASINDAPTIAAPSSVTTAEDTPVVISGLSFADLDAGSANETVTLSVGKGTLKLDTTVAGGLTAGQVAGNGTGSITVTAPPTAINATVASASGLTYLSNLNYNGSDTLSIGINDNGNTGAGGPLTASASIGLTITPVNDRPVVSYLETTAYNYTENDPATPITNTVMISDVDNATLASGTVSIDANFTAGQDVLGFIPNSATMGNISVSSNSGGVLSLVSAGATATTANWQAAFRAVTYQNTSEIPNTAIRRFLFQVNDGSLYSLQQYRYFTVSSVNDAPTIVAPSSVTTAEDTSVVISGISFADVDANGAAETISLSVANGILTLSTTVSGGLTAAQISGNGTGALTVTAPLAVINATLANAAGLTYRSKLNYNGSDSLSISINDLGNTGNGGAKTSATSVGLTIMAVNDPPTIVAPGTVTTAEDTAVVITGISFADVDAGSGIETVTLSVLHGTLGVNPNVVGGLTSSQITGNNTSSVTINASLTAINTTFADVAGFVYLGNTNYSGLDTLSIGIIDNGNTGAGGALTASTTVGLTITPVNDPPIISSGSINPLTILEDAATTSFGFGNLTFGPGGGSDEASQTLTYTVTAVPASSLGQVLLADGSTIVTASATYTLAQIQGMQFKPAPNANGTGTLTFAVRDNGGTVNGGSDTLINNVLVSVTAVNDQPVIKTGVINPLTVLEDAAVTSLGFGGLTFGPGGGPDEASQALTYKATVVTAPSLGNVLLADGTTVVTANTVYTLAQIKGMQFKPAPNANGSGTFTFTVQDNGGTANGGVDTLTNSVSITVTPVNDPPVITAGAINPLTVLEDAALTSLGFGTLTFSPGGGPDEASQTLTYKVTVVPSPTLGNVLLADGTTVVTANTFYTLPQIQGMQFKPALDANGSGSLTFNVQDNGGTANGGSDTLINSDPITVTPVNDQPVITSGTVNPLTILENSPITTLGFSNLSFGPGGGPDEVLQTLTYKVTAVPTATLGNILLADGKTVVTANTNFTLLQIQGMQFKPSLNANGAGTFTFTVQDSGGTANGGVDTLTNNVAITVGAVNNPPVILTGSVNPLTVLEDSGVTMLGFSTLTFGPGGGTDEASQTLIYKVTTVPSLTLGSIVLADGTTVVTANTTYSLTQLQGMKFKTALNANGSGTFTFTVQDNGGTANGGVDTLTNNVALTVTAVNDQPVILTGSVNSLTVLEDAAVTSLGFSNLTFGPGGGPDEASQTLTYTVTAVPSVTLGNILLADGTTVVNSNTTYSLTQIQGMQFKPAANVNGSGLFTFLVKDNGGTANGGVDTLTNSVALTVTAVNDQPVILSGSVNPLTVLEDSGVTTLGLSTLTFGPGGGPDEATQTLTYKVTAVPAPSLGSIVLADGTTVVTANTTYSLTQLQGMKFKTVPNANGSGTFTFTVQDNGGTANGGADTLTNNVFLTVTAVNDQPVILTGSVNPLTVLEDSGVTTLGLSALTFGPGGGPDEASQTLIYTVTAVPSSDIDSIGDIVLVDGTTVVTANSTYTLAQIQGMQFKTSLDANGSGTFTFTVKDNGGTANGGVDTLTVSIALTVIPVNDPPQIVSGSVNPLTVLEDAAATTLGFSDLNFVPGGSIDEFVSQSLSYIVTSVPSATLGNILLDDGTTVVTANTMYTLAQIQGMQFKPALNANGSGSFTFNVKDNGGTANGGVDTLAESVAITVTAVNDQPVILNGSVNPLTINEDAATTSLGFSNLTFGPGGGPDEASQTLTYKVTTVPAAGLGSILLADGTTVVTANTVYTLTQIQGMQFQPVANAYGVDTFAFTVQDNGGTANGGIDTLTNTVPITVNALNNAPTITAPVSLSTLEDTPLVIAGISFADIDGFSFPENVTLTVYHGTLQLRTDVANGLTAAQIVGNGTDTIAIRAPIAAINATLANASGLVYTPVLNYNSLGLPEHLLIKINDNGNTGSGGPQQALVTVPFIVTPVNDAPSGADKTVTTLEDTAYVFTAADFGFSDPSDNPANNFVAVKITTLPAAGTLKDNGTGVSAGQLIPVADVTSGQLTFTPAANGNGAGYASFTFQVQDDGGTANGGVDLDQSPNTLTINVTSVNDAPSGADKSVTTLEDTPYVFTSADFGFSDPNDNPANNLLAVKITTLPAAGSLKDNGTAVTAGQVIAVADVTSGKLVFTPAANAHGAGYASFTFQVQDDGGTLNGGVDLDQSPNTLTINITSVNDAPSGTDTTVTTLEDTPYVFTTADFGFSDPNDNPANNLFAVKITTLPAAGSLKNNGTAVTTGQVIAVADVTSGKLVFTPPANANGAGYASFTFQVQDDGGTLNGGVDLDQSPNTLTINVTSVNDAPSGTDKTITTLEDTLYVFKASDFGFTDPNDNPANNFLAVKITTLPVAGVLIDNGLPVIAGQTVTLADLSTNNFVFTPATNANGTNYATFTFQVQDDGGTSNGGVDLDQSPNTLTINVTPVNDAPSGTDKTVTTLEDTPYVFTTADFGFSDPNDNPANNLLAVKITTLPAAGTLKDNGTAVTAGQLIPVADVTSGKLVFTPAANGNGTGYASFTFQVQDDGGTANGGLNLDQSPNTLTINVTSVNDAPSGTDKTVTTLEDTPYVFATADFGFSDPNDNPANNLLTVKITTLPAAGILKNNGTAVTTGQVISVADVTSGKLVFTPVANANGAGYATFTFQVQDDGGTLNGGVDLDQSPNTLTINVISVNDAPSGADQTVTTLEDTAYVFTTADFGFSDPNDNPANHLLAVKITTLPAAGTLKDNGIAVTTGQLIAVADVTSGQLTFTPAANANGTSYTSFTFQVRDDGGTSNGGVDLDPSPNTLTINVTPVNDAPSGTDKTVTTLEDTAYVFTIADFGFTDPNDNPANQLLAVKIATLPVAGTLKDNGSAVTTGQVITVADVTSGKLVFTPAANANGAGYASFTFQVQDDGGTSNGGVDLDQSPNTLTIDVTAVNDQPVIKTGSVKPLTVLENDSVTTLGFSDLTFGQGGGADESSQTLTYTVTAVPASTLGDIVLADGTTIVTTGSYLLTDIQGMQFKPALNASGSDTFTFTVKDSGGTANGGVDTLLNSVAITVTPVNHPPVRINGSVDPLTVLEDAAATSLGFSSLSYGPGGGANEASQTLTYRAVLVPDASFGKILADGMTVSAGSTYTLAQIQGMQFQPAMNANGGGTFEFAVQDNGGTDHGGVDTLLETVTITVTPVNDPPVIATGTINPLTVLEDAAATSFGFSTLTFGPGGGPDEALQTLTYQVTAVPSPSLGTVLLGDGSTVMAGSSYSISQIQGMEFKPTLNANGTGTFTFTVKDNGGTENGGQDTLTNNVSVTVTSVNDAPMGTNGTVTTLQDTAYVFSANDFGFSDPNDNPQNNFLAVKIATLPVSGTLKDNGAAVTAGQFVSVSDIDAGLLVYKPAAGGYGAGYDSLTFQIQDDGGIANSGVDTAVSANSLSINVTFVAPVVLSINSVLPSPTNQSTISWTVTFNTLVTGVDPTDFSLVKTGTVSSNLLQVTGSGSVYTVTASGVTGNGTIGLNLVDDDSIVGSGVPLGTTGIGNGNFTGQVETIDTIFPYVLSINQASINGSSRSFTATFSEAVTGVTSSAFTLAETGSVLAATINVTPVSNSVYTIIVGGITGSGTLGVNLVDDGQIHDLAGNPLTTPNANAHFASQTTFATGTSPYTVTTGDLNADGKLDLIVSNENGNSLSVLLGNGNGTFQPQTSFATGSYPLEVTVGDVNGDGKLDLVVGNYGNNTVSVLLGNGDGTFQPQATFATGSQPWSVKLGDVNGDGIPDIVVANFGGDTMSVLLGNGDGTFQPQATFATGHQPTSVAICDVDGDGKPDLVVGNLGSNTVSVLLGNGNGTFQSQTTFATGANPRSVTLGDVNGDGKPDIVSADEGDDTVSVLLGNGNGTFQSQTTFAAGAVPFGLSLGDVNGDGTLDIVVSCLSNNSVGLLLGNGNGTFQSQVTFANGTAAFVFSVTLGDVNSDGKVDLVFANFQDNTVSVLLGNGNGDFTGQVVTV